MFIRKFLPLLTALFTLSLMGNAQVTTSSMSGFVKSVQGEALAGATVTLTNEATGAVSRTVTKAGGRYDFTNLAPGGPYTVTVSFVNFGTEKREDVQLTLGENSKQDFELTGRATELTTVTVAATRTASQGKGGTETTIGRDRIQNLPTVGRNITDYLRNVPQAKLGTTEGSISIAGQNNRYNAFYVDGALNNDVFGLAASGTNGGQANVAPISLDAIDQIQVVISPYDASLSGFTGGGINAITRSGTNTVTGSIYYTFRDQYMAGRTPTGPKENATFFGAFKNQTYGFRVGGPLIKNRLFYFLSGEIQRDERPQQFDTTVYRGQLRGPQLLALADTIRARYGYDPGGFINNPEKINANRITTKLDYTINERNKLSLTYRFNFGERFNTAASSASTINFYNNGVYQPSSSHYVTAELRSSLGGGKSNRLLFTTSIVDDDRGPIGQPFPRVQLFDGSNGTINLGSDNSSTVNLLKQRNYNLQDQFRFTMGRHGFTAGIDLELNDVYNAFIQNTFGNYQYSTVADFLNNAKPRQYSVGYSLLEAKTDENTNAAAAFKVFRAAAFISDEFKPSDRLTLTFGIRADKTTFATDPGEDSFTNAVALPQFAKHHDLKGARSGQRPEIPISISPRVGFSYRIPRENVTIRGGLGIFTGRIPLVWPGGMYNSNGFFQGGFTASSTQNPNALNIIRFRPDPFNQWRAQDVGITLSKGGLNLVSKRFQLPKVFRTSLGIDKGLGKGWTATFETFITKNISEPYYTNINILPPIGKSVGPGSRNVYPQPNVIPITQTGQNPYDNAILLSNADGKKGFSYTFSGGIDKRFSKGFAFSLNYSYGNSVVVHEQTSSVNLSQWRFVETVNGRNFIDRSVSDFDLGHRIFGYASKKFTYLNKHLATTITLTYTGQSGNPFSYTYATNSPIRDDAPTAATTNDLIYIPTASELQQQIFLTNTQTINGQSVTFTPQQQKDLLEQYIQNNKYMRNRRGEFAERNGDRMPFTNIVDLRVAQDFSVALGKRRIAFQVAYDIFNFTNMLNRRWGRTYFLSNDNFAPIVFAGYVSATNLTPQYRFNPQTVQPQSPNFYSTTSIPSFSPRWTSQLSLRFNF
jgi:outer membrane receptor for ferrienterochelin and colicin